MSSAQSAQQPVFQPHSQMLSSPQGDFTRDVVLGDMDGDGDVDALTAQGSLGNDQGNVIWLNQGDGLFEQGAVLGRNQSLGVALGDLDGDTDLDVFIANGNRNGGNSDDAVWLNQGGIQSGEMGVYSQTQSIANGLSTSVVLGDLDGDGDLDAVIGNTEQDLSRIWWNDGAGQFGPGPTLPARLANDVSLGDLDNDQDLDIVLAGEDDYFPTRIFWNHWSENKAFVAGPKLATRGINEGVTIAHLDGDEHLDIFVASSSRLSRVWWNNGNGTFAEDDGLSIDAVFATAGDLNGDATQDLLVAAGAWGNEVVLLNQGDRTFVATSDDFGDPFTQAAPLADLDGDGDLDAFAANWGQPDSIWLNVADEDSGSGSEGLFVVSDQQLASAYSSDVALGDFDNDGDLDAAVAGHEGTTIWLNGVGIDPVGVFSRGPSANTSGTARVALADLDGDGDLDLVEAFAVVGSGVEITVWMNGQPNGPPGSLQQVASIPGGHWDIAVGDVDGDGDQDIVGIRDEPEIWLNEGGFQFRLGQETDSDRSVSGEHVVLGDVDGDGDFDIVTTNFYPGDVQIWLNGEDGDDAGIFRMGQRLTTGEGSVTSALGDLDGDGDLDLYVVGRERNSIWLNGESGWPLGTFSDAGTVIDPPGGYGVALGDLDGDGDLDAFRTSGYNPSVPGSQIWENGRTNLAEQCLGSEWGIAVALGDLDGDGDLDAYTANVQEDTIWLNGDGTYCQCTVSFLFGQGLGHAEKAPAIHEPRSQSVPPGELLSTYRALRANLLPSTVLGREISQTFAQLNPEVFALVTADAQLRTAAISVLQLWQPAVQALLDGNGDSVTITPEQTATAQSFLDELTMAGSSELQQVVNRTMSELPTVSALAGKTVSSVYGELFQAQTIYLPSIASQHPSIAR